MLKELCENCKELYGSYKELNGNYISMKRPGVCEYNQEVRKNTIFEMKSTLEGIESRLDDAGDRISEWENKGERNTNQSKKREKDSERIQTV